MSTRLSLVLGALVVLAIVSGCGAPATNTSNTTPVNTVSNTSVTNSSTNTAANTNAVSTQKVTGTVFVKSYQTPSESYGILAIDGREIGMGAYDTMREQLRPYVGDKITVEFTNICQPDNPSCCRTVFDVCGIVKSWTPATNTNS